MLPLLGKLKLLVPFSEPSSFFTLHHSPAIFGLMRGEHSPIDNKNFQEQPGDVSLLTLELRRHLPPLYSQEHTTDPMVQAKFYFPTPDGWTWYAFEGSPIDENGYCDTDKEKVDFLFFGLVAGFENEIGYFSLSELESIEISAGTLFARLSRTGMLDVIDFDLSGLSTLKVIRDDHFEPQPLSEVKKHHG